MSSNLKSEERTLRMAKMKESFLAGIIKENPLLVSLLGLCPSLAVTRNVESAIGMGLLFLFVLVCSNVLVSLTRKIVPEEIATPCRIIIIAAFVTITKMLAEAFLPALYSSLGVFLSLLVVNCIVLGRAEAFASSHGPFLSFLDGVGNGIGFTLALLLISFIREVLGTGFLTIGAVFNFLPYYQVPFLKAYSGDGTLLFDYSISLFQNPAGAFLVLGVILAVIQAFRNYKKRKALLKKKMEAQK